MCCVFRVFPLVRKWEPSLGAERTYSKATYCTAQERGPRCPTELLREGSGNVTRTVLRKTTANTVCRYLWCKNNFIKYEDSGNFRCLWSRDMQNGQCFLLPAASLRPRFSHLDEWDFRMRPVPFWAAEAMKTRSTIHWGLLSAWGHTASSHLINCQTA